MNSSCEYPSAIDSNLSQEVAFLVLVLVLVIVIVIVIDFFSILLRSSPSHRIKLGIMNNGR